MKYICNILIPSSKLVSVEMQNEFGQVPPAYIPFMGKTTLSNIIKSYYERYNFAYVGINEGARIIENYYKFFKDDKIKLVKINKTISISDTIEKMLVNNKNIEKKPIIINFSDTIINDLDLSLIGQDFIVWAKTNETERWTLFKEDRGKITHISDKKFIMDKEGWKTFVGVWGFRNSEHYFNLIEDENRRDKKNGFYNSLSRYSQEHPFKLYESDNWIDVGHVDNYFSARRRVINTRFFNKVIINENSGTITKTSKDVQKLRNEINWYLTIPSDLKYLTPTIFNYSLDYPQPFIEMEFYSYPSLDECFVYAKYSFDVWNKIFFKIFSIINMESKYQIKNEDFKQDIYEMYHEKTMERLKILSVENPILFKKSNNIYVNSEKLISLKYISENIAQLLEEYKVYNINNMQIIHGDLCFNNILFDNKNGIIKLIDPRGKFGRYLIYGDVYYDLAKISHSVLGLYDLIMFEQFKIKSHNDNTIQWITSDYHNTLANIFKKYLLINGYDIRRVRFIESLLFLSMIPLHKDNLNKQYAMLIRGLSILTNLLHNKTD